MSTQNAAPANPVGRTRQNDFREQRVSDEQETATWLADARERAVEQRPTVDTQLASDELGFYTVAGNPDEYFTADLTDGTVVLTPPMRLLADDPSRRRVQLINFGAANLVYLCRDRGPLDNIAAVLIAADNTNGSVGPTVALWGGGAPIEIESTREVWCMIAPATEDAPCWVSLYVERGTRVTA